MPQNVYGIDAAGKFYLVAVPTLVGAFMRIPVHGGARQVRRPQLDDRQRPAAADPDAADVVGDEHVRARPYTTFMVVAAFAGFGGGNFASSMTNINAFYPQRLKGWALGLNAGGGNIGVPVIQLIGLLVIATVGNTAPELVCAIYLVLIALAAVGAAFFMDNLRNQKSNLGRARGGVALQALLGDELPLHRHVRIVHRVLVRLRPGTADQLPGRRRQRRAGRAARRSDLVPRAAARLDLATVRRQARRPHRWRQDHALHLRRDDPRRRHPGGVRNDGRRPQGRAHRRPDDRLRRRIHRAVHPVGHRQRLDVQDDPVDLRGEGAGQGRTGARRRRPRGRGACRVR